MLDTRAIGIEHLPPLFNPNFTPSVNSIQRDPGTDEVPIVTPVYDIRNDDRSNRNGERLAQVLLADKTLHFLIEQQKDHGPG